jgi:hypothetical protein
LEDILLIRFERYFAHPGYGNEVLRPGDHAVSCKNVRQALAMLNIAIPNEPADSALFDKDLEEAVKHFQQQFCHRVSDGLVGPGTRKLLVSHLLNRYSPDIFLRLDRSEVGEGPSVFLSYAWKDSAKVDKLDQWLRDRGVKVFRDHHSFTAGSTISDNVRECVAMADKTVAVFSANSRDRDWPRLERTIAEEVEVRLGRPVLIYLCLDDSPLPAHDPTRLAILGTVNTLKQVGEEILHSLTGTVLEPRRHHYDEDEPL